MATIPELFEQHKPVAGSKLHEIYDQYKQLTIALRRHRAALSAADQQMQELQKFLDDGIGTSTSIDDIITAQLQLNALPLKRAAIAAAIEKIDGALSGLDVSTTSHFRSLQGWLSRLEREPNLALGMKQNVEANISSFRAEWLEAA